MSPENFDREINRLKGQWPSAYGAERIALFFRTFRTVPDDIFSNAVTRLIATQRAAPLLDAIEAAVNVARNEHADELRQFNARQPASFVGQLNAASKRTTADPEFVKACMKTLRDFLERRISKVQFREACGVLDSAAQELIRR